MKKAVEPVSASQSKEEGATWIVRDSRGRRVLGTAKSLAEAIREASKLGEQFPVLERMTGPGDDSAGPVLWRRTF